MDWYSYDDLNATPFPIEWEKGLEYIRRNAYIHGMLYRGYSPDEISERVITLENEIKIAELQNMLEQQRYAMEHNCSNNSLKTRNIAYDKPKKVEPFIIVYKSKPIQGIVLELWGKNPEYNWEIEIEK